MIISRAGQALMTRWPYSPTGSAGGNWTLRTASSATFQHSGFAVLSVVVSYFEMIAKYRDGFVGTGKSEHYFTQGVEWVFPAIRPHQQVLKRLYKAVRCGMYHSGITLHGVVITDEGDAALRSSQDGQNIIINPHQLVPALQDHFSRYVVTLQNASNEAERLNFQKRFDRGV